MVPLKLKNLNDVGMFSLKLENPKQGNVNANYKLCLPYVYNIRYVNISNN